MTKLLKTIDDWKGIGAKILFNLGPKSIHEQKIIMLSYEKLTSFSLVIQKKNCFCKLRRE